MIQLSAPERRGQATPVLQSRHSPTLRMQGGIAACRRSNGTYLWKLGERVGYGDTVYSPFKSISADDWPTNTVNFPGSCFHAWLETSK